MNQTKSAHNGVCNGGIYDGRKFTYSGENDIISYNGGFYLRTPQTNLRGETIWTCKQDDNNPI